MAAPVFPELEVNIPEEVRAFAKAHGVDSYLPDVIAMTQRLYPSRPVRLKIVEDPEIADDRRICLEVDVIGFSVDQLVQTQWQWSEEIFKVCPATHVWVFQQLWYCGEAA
jgi:hypothetical protein